VPIITCVEQRTERIDEDTYHLLSSSVAFRELVQRGVVSLVTTRDVPYGIRGGHFVGQSLLGAGLQFQVKEKVPGALQDLLEWSIPADLREVRVAAPLSVARTDILMERFASKLATALTDYLRRGRYKEYATHEIVGSAVRGRVDLRRTIALRSRGRFGRVATDHQELTADVTANRLLGLALHVVEASFRWSDRGRHQLDQARYYAPLFEDVAVMNAADLDWDGRAAAFQEALEEPRLSDDLKRALLFARAIVLSLGPWPVAEWEYEAPSSWFINLYTLFEEAVRQVLTETVQGRYAVMPGRQFGRFVLQGEELYKANPDLVVLDGDAPVLVGDCKYKDLAGDSEEAGLPAQADIYQLLIHCQALGCRRGVLIYPNATPSITSLGSSSHGVKVELCLVRPSLLPQDLSELLPLPVPG